MKKIDMIHEHYVLRSGLNSLRVLIFKKIPLESLTPEQDADAQAIANKNKYYRTTEPDDIDYEAEWAFIDTMNAKYSDLPDAKS